MYLIPQLHAVVIKTKMFIAGYIGPENTAMAGQCLPCVLSEKQSKGPQLSS